MSRLLFMSLLLTMAIMVGLGRARFVDGGVVAFIADCRGESNIYLMDVARMLILRLTDHNYARNHLPQWAADELKFVEGSTHPLIFYGAGHDVITADAPGFFLPSSPTDASNIWGQAPDGRWALVMFRDNNYELYVTEFGNQRARRLTFNQCDEHYPRWQP
jgi:hypothetical protein